MTVESSLPPLADLHRHLDGSLRPGTLAELAARAGKEVPADLAFSPGMGLAAALARFGFTLSLLQGAEPVRRVAAEMCEDAAAEGVSTLEIRFAPQLHLESGASIEEIVDAAVEGASGRAGILLCGLYGEAPDVLERLVDAAASRPGVVGIDLAGGPAPGHSFGMVDYAAAFRRAESLGLGRTVHAAEGRPAHEIRVAVETLRAQRIGHGMAVLDDPGVTELVVERGVTIEACPTSNVHTGLLRSVEEHPIARWLDAGVRACLCADNTLLSDTTAAEEARRARKIPGMTGEKLARAIAFGHEGAFRRGG